MVSLYNAPLKPLAYGEKTHSYDHATKLFIADNLRLAPKQSFLYYVVLNIDVGIIQNLLTNSQSLNDPISSQDIVQQYEAGLMAKRVDLPKFTMATKTLNAYNRKNIIQTGIQYDPISITFHDDSADIITNLWNDYYTYYYRDSDYDGTLYQIPHKYQNRNSEKWGYTPRNQSLKPFFRNIQIFSLHNKRFTEYTLINPFISSWRHGEHDSSNGSGTMEATMTLSYETVKYRTGYVNAVDVNGFSVLHYDNFQSPISTSKTNIFTDAGFIGSVEGAAKDLARPDGTIGNTNVLSNIMSAYRFYNGVKNANLGSIVNTTIGQIGQKIISSAINGVVGGSVFPTIGGIGSIFGSSQVYSNSGILGYSPYSTPVNNLGVAIAGSAASIAAGAAVNITNQAATQLSNDITRGISTGTGGLLSQPAISPVYDLKTNSRFVQVDEWGRPVAGQGTTASVTLNAQGQPVAGQVAAAQSSAGTLATDYDPKDKSKNAVSTEEISKDAGGTITQTVTYSGGTKVTRELYLDGTSRDIKIVPGANTTTIDAKNNTPTAGSNLYRDTKTGIIYDRSGTLGAQVQNSISQTTGTLTGLYAGQQLNQALNSTALGKTVLGRTVSGAVSGAVGAQVGIWTNNGTQLVLNKVSGVVSKAWDSASGEIKSVVGSWIDGGAYDSNDLTKNMVSKSKQDDGTWTYTYKDGTKVDVYDNGVRNVTLPEGANSSWSVTNWASGVFGSSKDSSVLQPTGSSATDASGTSTSWWTGIFGGSNDLTLDEINKSNNILTSTNAQIGYEASAPDYKYTPIDYNMGDVGE